MKEKFSLKDHLFNKEKVEYLAGLLASADTKFNVEAFIDEVMSKLLTLELKDRIRWIAEVLTRHLPRDYEAAVAVIIRALPPPLDPTKTDNDFGDFIFAPFGEYVATQGCTKERLALSLETIKELTKRFSMEDAIRYFLRTFPKETLKVMKIWSKDENYHVRRLVSEGTRPLLPWSVRVPVGSVDTLPLLTVLHADTTRYVTRSVANHLNDIAKIDPQLVIETLKKWQQQATQHRVELAWLTKHALRTLIKQGHTESLQLLGYSKVTLQSIGFSVTPATIRIGEVSVLCLTCTALVNSNVLIDYRIHFQKKNGTTAPKVFKWKTLQSKSGELVTLQKRHLMKGDATTFRLYPGPHTVDVQINGTIVATTSFELKN